MAVTENGVVNIWPDAKELVLLSATLCEAKLLVTVNVMVTHL